MKRKFITIILSMLMLAVLLPTAVMADEKLTITSDVEYYNKNSKEAVEFIIRGCNYSLSTTTEVYVNDTKVEQKENDENNYSFGHSVGSDRNYVYFYSKFIESFPGDINVEIRIGGGYNQTFNVTIKNEFYELAVDVEAPEEFDVKNTWWELFVDGLGYIDIDRDVIYVPKGSSITTGPRYVTDNIIFESWYFNGQKIEDEITPTQDGALTLKYDYLSYELDTNTNDIDFGSLNPGYEVPPAKELTITNEGNEAVILYDFSNEEWAEYNPKYYNIDGFDEMEITYLWPGESVTLSVTPLPDLPLGNYDETITFYGIENMEIMPLTRSVNRARPSTSLEEATLSELDVDFHFSVVEKKAEYTLTFDTGGGETIEKVTQEEGTSVDLSKYVPSRSGYEFGGWYLDKELSTKVNSVVLDSNKVVYAAWEEVKVEVPETKPETTTPETTPEATTEVTIPDTGDGQISYNLLLPSALTVMAILVMVKQYKQKDNR